MTCTYWHAHARLQKLNLQNVTECLSAKNLPAIRYVIREVTRTKFKSMPWLNIKGGL